MTADSSCVLVPGPWEHRFVAANGARFHVASLGEGPLVVLLHGFPQFWWTWRHQLQSLAEAGYRAVAMDLRGYGASDKPPTGYDAPTLTADVAGVIRSLGESEAVVVGHGIGGWLAWTLSQSHPDAVRAVVSVASPHPADVATARLSLTTARGAWSVLAMNRPWHPERSMARGAAYVHHVLRSWQGHDPAWPSREETARYAEAMAIPFAAHSAVEGYRWLSRARLSPAGREYLRQIRRPVTVPVLHIHGTADTIVAPSLAAGSARWMQASYQWCPLPGVGHAPHEQAPERVSLVMINWLQGPGSP
ncbi:Haloalkane dehalogenase [Austwickia sp. TVS 96-490-7B]|uniref:alpha/beta fold hydrolase n=1 Tax=Austwickia sp. TVS 96-490-7B TaxID=2830843 RepID=UPI001C567669|nr:alpha/beta hydrolase [Austwickia sp. TVS 96-490-7B]MBW3084921.1 Haloalkane dehalogenase [Austwickia sp. TVS 96-490-7B]